MITFRNTTSLPIIHHIPAPPSTKPPPPTHIRSVGDYYAWLQELKVLISKQFEIVMEKCRMITVSTIKARNNKDTRNVVSFWMARFLRKWIDWLNRAIWDERRWKNNWFGMKVFLSKNYIYKKCLSHSIHIANYGLPVLCVFPSLPGEFKYHGGVFRILINALFFFHMDRSCTTGPCFWTN